MVRNMKNGNMGMIIPLMVFALVFVLVPAVPADQNAVQAQPVMQTQIVEYAPAAGAVQVACPSGCECLTEAEAKEKFGSYERCSDVVCAKVPVTTSSAAPVERYCFRKSPGPVPVCPYGCSCMRPEEAERYGYSPCGNAKTICGAVATTGTSVETSYSKNMYCYAKISTGAPCPAGAECMTEQEAKEKYRIYSLVSKVPCGYEKPVISTAASATPEYCIRPGAVPVTPSVISVSACKYDPDKNACTGTCSDGKPCSVMVTAMNMQTSEKVTACTCPVEGGCSFDYATGTCTGSCPSNTGKCQVNTIYKDISGKIIYGECHCKNVPGRVPEVTAIPYVVGSSLAYSNGTAEEIVDSSGIVSATITGSPDIEGQITGSCQKGGACDASVAANSADGQKTDTTPTVYAIPAKTTAGGIDQPSEIVRSLGTLIRSFFGLKLTGGII
jgi:hypothetical protein